LMRRALEKRVRYRMMDEDSEGQVGRKELLANIRRLTIAVLDSLEEGSRDKTLDHGEKRLLSSTGARLLRLWRNALKDDAINQADDHARKTTVNGSVGC